MIRSNDGCAEVDGSAEELRFDFYEIVTKLLDVGVYESAQDILNDVIRVAEILNMSWDSRMQMLFKYDIKAGMQAESTLMHELEGVG